MVLYPTTKVIDAKLVTAVAPDLSTMTFSSVSNVAVGDVVLGGIGPQTPSGFLRRVTSINGTTLATQRATLQDAIQKGHIRLPATRLRKEGATLKAQTLHPLADTGSDSFDQDFTLGINDVKVTDGVTAGASLGFGLGVDVDITINFSKVAMKLVLSGNEAATVDIHASASAGFDEPKKVTIATYYFPPIPIDIAGIPIVITSELDVRLGINGHTGVAVDWSATEKASMDVGLEVGTDGVNPTITGKADASADITNITGDLSLRGFAELEVSIAVNELIAEAGVAIGARGFAQLDANVNATQGTACWSATRGIEGYYNAKAEVLGFTLAETEDSKVFYGGEFAHGDCNPNAVPVDPFAAVIDVSNLDTQPRLALLPDGSFVVGADKAGTAGYVGRFSAAGAPIWEHALEGTVGIHNVSAAPANDGSSWLFGTWQTDATMLHLAKDGTKIGGFQVLGGDRPSPAEVLFVAAKDGGVLMGGQTLDEGSTFVTWAARLDATGKLLWNKTYGAMGGPRAIAEANDGGILLAGDTVVGPGAATEVMRIAPNGDPVFARTYGEGRLYGITAISSGGMAATGATATGDGGVVLRIADDGALTWGYSYEDTDSPKQEYQSHAIVERSDGILVAGRRGFSSGADFWAMHVSPMGELVWSRTWGGADNDEVYGLVRTSDNGAIMVGETKSFPKDTNTHLLLVRIPPSGAFDPPAASGLATKNVPGIKKPLPGNPTTQSPVAGPLNATAKTADASVWPFTPFAAKYTKL